MLLRKAVYPYEFMDDWERFNENHYQKKKNFIVTKICSILQIQIKIMQKESVTILKYKLGEYHDLYLKKKHIFISWCA